MDPLKSQEANQMTLNAQLTLVHKMYEYARGNLKQNLRFKGTEELI